ncbi:MAG: competence/damage-inducible protein A [Alistipes sp.]|nr:competence/damage-inducible protein A [Alistipes sp.]
MHATIITIGDEILIGQIVDTNSVSIARRLNAIGITVSEKLSIGDGREQILSALDRTLQQSDVIIITGGLGPTKDDITKHTLAEYFSQTLVENSDVAHQVERMLAARGIAFNSLNRAQALVPDGCTVLFNHHGTAPGMWFESAGNKVVVSLPGVPFEMEHLMEDEVIPRLKHHFSLHANIHRTMITAGIAESMLAERIAVWEDALPPYLKLAYLPAPNVVRLRLSAYDVDEQDARERIEREFSKLYTLIPDNIVGFEDASIEQLVHRILTSRGETLATAESCTGGAIASKFTAQAGASAYFRGGVVSYATDIKHSVLGVAADIIEHQGVVSEATAKAMAEGARRLMQSDYAIATTGIAGPSGGTSEHPVGEVWMAIATPEGVEAVRRQCGTDRGQIIARATAYAIEMLYNKLKIE